jgi:hypothetical protein
MIYQIITHTPIWVWALLALLVYFGYQQTKSRTIGLRRAAIIPVILTALSIYGTLSAFGSSPLAILAWLAAATALATTVMLLPVPSGTRFDSQTRQLHIIGSWVPMALIMGIFVTKYVVGVALSMHPELAQKVIFALTFSSLYGAFSGVFIGRSIRLWRLTTQRVLADPMV